MESSSSTQLKVGIYLAIGIAVILASIFFLGADKALFTRYIRLHAHFEEVQGLAIGSVVSLSGVTVGNVEDIVFLPEKNALDLKLKINENYINRIRKGSQVEIRTQGALGDKFVFIIPSSPKEPAVNEGDVLDVAKATDVFGIISERGKETSQIFDIINELHKAVYSLNANNRLAHTMANIESASSNLSLASKDAQNAFAQLNLNNSGQKLGSSLEKLDTILTKIDRGEGTLGALINDPTVHNQLKTFLGGSSRKNHVKSLLRTSIEKED